MSTKAFFINSADAKYSDEEFAWFQSLMLTEGVIGEPDTGNLGLQVTEKDPAGMAVLVSPGHALVEVTIDGRTFKVVAKSDAEEELVIGGNAGASNRVDAVIVRVDTDTEPNETKSNIVSLEVVEGTGTSPLTDEAIDAAVDGDGWYRLADVTVPPSATSIEDANIEDTRRKIYFADGVGIDQIFIGESERSVDPADDAGKVAKLEADGYLSRDFLPPADLQILNANGNWDKPYKGEHVRVQLWGAGASGASRSTNGQASGGGGGGYVEAWFSRDELPSSVACVIGQGGAAVSGNSEGLAGGDTAFGDLLTAYGGGRGSQSGTTSTFSFGGGGGGLYAKGTNGNFDTGGEAGNPGVPIAGDGRDNRNGFWGGGGGGKANSAGASTGGRSIYGGGGGGSVAGNGSMTAIGGTSVRGGKGGDGKGSGGGEDGAVPGGGGGGGIGGGGKGGNGRIVVTVF